MSQAVESFLFQWGDAPQRDEVKQNRAAAHGLGVSRRRDEVKRNRAAAHLHAYITFAENISAQEVIKVSFNGSSVSSNSSIFSISPFT